MTPDIASVCVLAAGQGKRMKSELPKVLHKVCGRPMLLHVLAAAASVRAAKTVVVLGHGADMVVPYLPDGCAVAIQKQQNGTGDALLSAEAELAAGPALVLPGDTPLVTGAALEALVARHQESGASATVLTMILDDPTGYGRIIRDDSGAVVRIVEHRDASPEELTVREVNTGMFVLPVPAALDILRTVGTDNDQGEIYLTDVISGLVARGDKVAGAVVDDPGLVLGVNSPVELAEAETILGDRIKEQWMLEGVTLIDPRSTLIEAGVRLSAGTVIRPFTSLCGDTHVAGGCDIGPSTTLIDTEVGEACALPHVWARSSRIAAGTALAPFTKVEGER